MSLKRGTVLLKAGRLAGMWPSYRVATIDRFHCICNKLIGDAINTLVYNQTHLTPVTVNSGRTGTTSLFVQACVKRVIILCACMILAH